MIKPRKASDLYPILTFQLFDSGKVVITPSVQAHLDREGVSPDPYVERHTHGDWGDVSAKDAEMNLLAVLLAGRPFSSYLIAGKRVWVKLQDRAWLSDTDSVREASCHSIGVTESIQIVV